MNRLYNMAKNTIQNGLLPSSIISIEAFKSEETSEFNASTFAMMITTIFVAFVYIVAMVALWVRIVYYAFGNGPGEGVSAIFFYNLYIMYFVGSTISSTNKSYI